MLTGNRYAEIVPTTENACQPSSLLTIQRELQSLTSVFINIDGGGGLFKREFDVFWDSVLKYARFVNVDDLP